MLLASNNGAGQNIGFPDTCNTPQPTGTVPIPYPNIATNAQAAPFSAIVRITGMNALNQDSKIPMTNGDEAGVAHSSFMQKAAYTTGNPVVNIEGSPGINLACPTSGNNQNCSSACVAVPSATTVFYTLRPLVGQPLGDGAAEPCPGLDGATSGTATDPYGRAVDAGGLARLEDAMTEPAVHPRMVASGVAYLRITLFNPSVPTLVFRALRRLEGAPLRALVIDLRDNPGGDTDAMVRLADDFLPQDAIIIRKVDPEGDERVLRARQADPYDVALTILVNESTASAAELFAGCLQHHGRATVVGQRTFGKGQGQQVVPELSGQGVYYASVAHCLLPDGRSIDGRGVEPDLAVPHDESADRQLETAITHLG